MLSSLKIATCVYISCLYGATVASVTAAETVVFDMARNDGTAGAPIANGVHGGWFTATTSDTDVPNYYAKALKPSFISTRFETDKSFWWGAINDPTPTCDTDCIVNDDCDYTCYAPSSVLPWFPDSMLYEMNELESTVILYTSKYNNPVFNLDPDDSTWWLCYEESYLDTLISRVRQASDIYPDISFVYDVWPEVNAAPGSVFTKESYLRLYEKTYNYVRSNDSTGAKIMAPSLHWPFVEHSYEASGKHESMSDLNTKSFGDFVDSLDIWPDIIGWHSFDSKWENLSFADDDVDSEQVAIDDTLSSQGWVNVPSGIEFGLSEAGGSLLPHGATGAPPALSDTAEYVPGFAVHRIGRAEKSKEVSDLLFYGRSYRVEGAEGFLGGLIKIDTETDSVSRSDEWWVRKAYADLEGEYVLLDTSPWNFDGLASKDSTNSKITVLLGAYRAYDLDLKVQIDNLNETPWVMDTDIVQVRVWRYQPDIYELYEDVEESELLFFEERMIVEGDSLVVDLSGARGIDLGDAVRIEISPPEYQTILADGQVRSLDVALGLAEFGDTVRVDELPGGIPHPPIVIKRRVILQRGEDNPEISAVNHGAATPVAFSADSDDRTWIEGLTIAAGDSTDTLISFRGTQGKVKNCSLDPGGSTGALIGVGVPNATATPGHVIQIVKTTVDVDNGNSGSFGIKSYTRPVSVTNSLVMSSGKGVYGAGHQVVNTTIDASNYAVELWNGSLVENSILVQLVTEVRADTFRYCILPDLGKIERWYAGSWTSNNDTLGVSDEDPLFCFVLDDYSLRLDSYGNPKFNGSGKVIGARPVTCIEGILARDLVLDQPTIVLTNTAEIPESLSVSADTSMAINIEALSEASWIVYGALDLRGSAAYPIKFESEAHDTVEAAGDWHGLAFRDGAVVAMEYVGVLHTESGMIVDSGTPSSVRLSDVTVDEFYSEGILIDAADTLEMIDVTVTGDSVGDVGILVGADDAVLTNIEVTGLTTGTAIEIDASGVTLNSNNSGTTLIEDCKKGIWIYGSSNAVLEADNPSNDTFEIKNCTTGIYVSGSADPQVTDIEILDSTTGIHVVGSAEGDYKDVDITRGDYGMNIDSGTGTTLTFREGDIRHWEEAAVMVGMIAEPDFGTSSSHGENDLLSDSCSFVPMKIKKRISPPPPDVSAQYNYWGQSPPPTMTYVDASNHLTSASSLSEPDVDIARMPVIEALALGFLPNPMGKSGGVIQLALPEHTGPYRVEVYDVQGRLVRIPGEGQAEFPQLQEIAWDGTDRRGVSVPAGVYFIRLSTREESHSVKIVKSQ